VILEWCWARASISSPATRVNKRTGSVPRTAADRIGAHTIPIAPDRVQPPAMDKDPLDVDLALERLGTALPLQLRSAAAFTMAAGSITGFNYIGLTELLWSFAQADLADARRLVEKIVTLGGAPVDSVTGFDLPDDGDKVIERLIELETEVIEALQDTIPATGHTGDSEALEHRLEHMIMRKQEAVDTLRRARRS